MHIYVIRIKDDKYCNVFLFKKMMIPFRIGALKFK